MRFPPTPSEISIFGVVRKNPKQVIYNVSYVSQCFDFEPSQVVGEVQSHVCARSFHLQLALVKGADSQMPRHN